MHFQTLLLNSARTKIAAKMSSFAPKSVERVASHKPSIWVEFTKLAAETKSVNLGQGFPDCPAPRLVTEMLKKCAEQPELTAAHQYTRGAGHPLLVEMLGKMYSDLYKTHVDPMNDVLVTVGASMALYYAFHGWVEKGDEVVVIEPAYDCYNPQIRFAGGTPVPVTMSLPAGASSASQFQLDFTELERKITARTKVLVINNPHNPTGKLFTSEELEKVADIVKRHNLLVVADEVYEFHVWKPKDMIRFASLPGMYERTISIGSAGKAFSVTGWKLGWAVGPKELLEPMRLIHQNCAFTCSSPTQMAVAEALRTDWPKFMAESKDSYLASGLAAELLPKKDRLAQMLEAGGFRPIMPEAGYFMLADFGHLLKSLPPPKDNEALDFVCSRWLAREKGISVIPPSAFYSDPDEKRKNSNLIRLCFFKKEETLDAAELILKELGKNY